MEENKQRLSKLEKQFHVKAHRRYEQRETAKVKAEEEGKKRFESDRPARERQKEAEKKRKKQKEDEAREKRDREKVQGVKDRIEALEKKREWEDWVEVIERAKVTGRERYVEGEEEGGREYEEVMEEEWKAIADTFDVLLPGIHIHIPESLEWVERHACRVNRSGDHHDMYLLT